MSKCIGCGQKIQTIDPNQVGYVPLSSTMDSGDQVYCQRCYKIIHHNLDYSSKTYQITKSSEALKELVHNYYQKLDHLRNQKALIMLMVDAMDLFGGFIPKLDEYVGNNPVIILVNKVDVLPKSIKTGKLKEVLMSLGKKAKLNVRDVYFISSLKEQNITILVKKIMTYFTKKGPGNLCYVVGATSVGKSTFINQVLKQYQLDLPSLTTSSQHQTTLDTIRICLGVNAYKEKCYLVDTPGYLNLTNFTTYLTLQSLKVLTPRNFLRVRSYQLQGEQTIFLGGLGYLEFIEAVNVAFYVSNDLYLHRTKRINQTNIWENQRFTLLKPPFSSEEADHLAPLVKHCFEFKASEVEQTVDIAISGIGYIHLVNPVGQIIVNVPEGIKVVKYLDLI